MKYVPGLDGIRAIAVLAVMAFHAFPVNAKPAYIAAGFYGVDVFFVLSGFLITTLLLTEHDRTGRIAFVRFYMRRFARLMPPLLLLLLAYIAVAPLIWPNYDGHLRDAGIAAVYFSDYARAIWRLPDYIKHTWSLSVEEHFYLLWPLAILFLGRLQLRTMIFVLAALYVVATAWRFYCIDIGQGWGSVYPRFDTRLSGLILGALAAATLRYRPVFNVRQSVLLVLGALVVIVCMTHPHGALISLRHGLIVIELFTAACIVAIMHNTAGLRWLGCASLNYIGRLSYGLYLFHYPVMYYLRDTYGWQSAWVGGSAISLACAALSYHTIEAWVRRLKGRMDPTPATDSLTVYQASR